MDIWLNLFLGVLSSIIAGIILLFLGVFLSERLRWVLTAILGRLLDIDTDFVFANGRAASDDIHKELERSKSISLLAARGSQLQNNEAFAPMFREHGIKKQIRVLLPTFEPIPLGQGVDWTDQRNMELRWKVKDPAFESDLLRRQIQTTIESLRPYVNNSHLELKLFNAPHLCRLILTDRCAFFTPYQADAHGRDSHVIKYRRGGDMYEWLERLFDLLWEQSLQVDKT